MNWAVSQDTLDQLLLQEERQSASTTQAALARAESERDNFREGWLSRGRSINRMGDILRNPPREIADLIEEMEGRYPETVIARALCSLILHIENRDQ
jgi:hypothetical protein